MKKIVEPFSYLPIDVKETDYAKYTQEFGKKTKIKASLKERPHQFADGKGKVADKILIEIQLPKNKKQSIQAHNDFLGVVAAHAYKGLLDEYQAYVENI